MSRKLSTAFGILVVLAGVGLVSWAVVRGVEAEPSVVGSFATAFGAVVAVVVQRDRENKREVQRAHREVLAPIYEELFEHFKGDVDLSFAIRRDLGHKNSDLKSGDLLRIYIYDSDTAISAWQLQQASGSHTSL